MQTATGPVDVAKITVIGELHSLNAIIVEKTVSTVDLIDSIPDDDSAQSITKNKE